MKKKISSKLTLGKRAVAVLNDEEMSTLQGGNYVSQVVKCGGGGGFTTCLASFSSCTRCP